jgi:hypothetical protein
MNSRRLHLTIGWEAVEAATAKMEQLDRDTTLEARTVRCGAANS